MSSAAEATKPSIAFFGLGLMGYPMASHMSKAGHVVHVYNRTQSKVTQFVQDHPTAIAIQNVKQVLEDASIKYILIMLFDFKAIQETIFAMKPILTGKILVCHATISVEQSQALDSECEALGGNYVEAPVLGTNTVAQQAKLQVLLAGKQSILTDLQLLLAPLGGTRVVGTKNKACKMKLTCNLMVGNLTLIIANALALVEKNDLEADMFLDIIRNSAFYYKYMDIKAPRMLKQEYDDPNFSVQGLLKDLKNVEQMAQDSSVDTELIHALKGICEKRVAQSKTQGNEDFASVYETFKNVE